MARIISCHFSADKASSFTLRMEPTPYSPTALRNLLGLIRMDWPCPSVTIPISSCVIWPIFSLSVSLPRSVTTAAAEALAGGPAGVIFFFKNVWLSTIPGAASSAPDGTATTVQTASTITICHSFLFGVDTGISLPSILPLVAGYIQILVSLNSNCGPPKAGTWQPAFPRDICKWGPRVAALGGDRKKRAGARVLAGALGLSARLSAAKNTGSAGSAACVPSATAYCTPAGSPDVPHRPDNLCPRDTDTAEANAAGAARR